MLKNRSNKNIWSKIKTVIVIIGFIITLITVNNKPLFSQTNTGLNSEISSLRSRINRLESEVRNLRPSRSTSISPNNNIPRESLDREINNPPMVGDRAIGKSDPLFERLATLIIELKEDVNNIENRLGVLEEKTGN